MADGGQEVDVTGPLRLAAAQGLAVNGDAAQKGGGLGGRGLAGQMRQDTLGPARQGPLQGSPVEAREDGVEGADGGRLAPREAEGLGQVGAVVPAPLGDGPVTLIAAEGGGASQRKDRGERVTLPPWAAEVGDLGQHLDERTANGFGHGRPREVALPLF